MLTRRHPVWLLVTKEIRLQQLALVIAGLYLLGWLANTLLVADVHGVFNGLSALYALLLGVLIGSIASAEERELGTIEWQVLQPIATWEQWAVKIGVALGLAMLLGIGLPMVLAHVAPATDMRPFPHLASTVLLLTAGSLYVSSLCASGAWALVMSLPATLGAMLFHFVALHRVGNAAYTAWRQVFNVAAPSGVDFGGFFPGRAGYVLDLLLITGFIAIVLGFALANHRSAERSAWRTCRQVILMAAYATAGVVILCGVAALFGRRW